MPPTQNRKVTLLLEIVTDQKNQNRPTASHPTPIAICTRVSVRDMRHNLSRLSGWSSSGLPVTGMVANRRMMTPMVRFVPTTGTGEGANRQRAVPGRHGPGRDAVTRPALFAVEKLMQTF
jgi:hypothetical protein